MRSAIVAAALLATGCAADSMDQRSTVSVDDRADVVRFAPAVAPSWIVVVDDAFPAWKERLVRSALDDWATRVRCPFVYEVVRGPTTPFGSSDPEPGTIEVREDDALPEADAIGFGKWYEGRGSRVSFLRSFDSEDRFPRVARHEVGHALHLPHDDRAPALMNSNGVGLDDVGDLDVEDYESTWCAASEAVP